MSVLAVPSSASSLSRAAVSVASVCSTRVSRRSVPLSAVCNRVDTTAKATAAMMTPMATMMGAIRLPCGFTGQPSTISTTMTETLSGAPASSASRSRVWQAVSGSGADCSTASMVCS